MSRQGNVSTLKSLNNKQGSSILKNELYRRVVDVCEQLKKRDVLSSVTLSAAGHTNETEDQEKPVKRLKIDTGTNNLLFEVESLKAIRRRTFSHWPQEQIPSVAQMISAGFFSCNVGDRVICLYCNLICQQWKPHVDDPQEAHEVFAPQCPYVILMLKKRQTTMISILNENSTNNVNSQSRTLGTLRLNEIVHTSACHSNYVEIPKRQASFTSWPQDSLPSIDDLVRAGFFYTGTNTVVTCFYCNGSLQNWGEKDNPTVEHCRWFPHCAYARQLCGDELYQKVQALKRTTQERVKVNQSTNRSRLLSPDENTLSRMVAARIDLPISQRLLDRNFKLAIIKRCWEDQLRLKQDDFTSDCDLLIACVILQKQIEHINGKKENIIVPSVKMKLIREKDQTHTLADEQSTSSSSSVLTIEGVNTEHLPNTKNINASEIPTTSIVEEQKTEVKASSGDSSSSSSNLCVLCWTEEKRLACIPCGHLATCVPCGHSLRICPICRKDIEAFVRIYI